MSFSWLIEGGEKKTKVEPALGMSPKLEGEGKGKRGEFCSSIATLSRRTKRGVQCLSSPPLWRGKKGQEVEAVPGKGGRGKGNH